MHVGRTSLVGAVRRLKTSGRSRRLLIGFLAVAVAAVAGAAAALLIGALPAEAAVPVLAVGLSGVGAGTGRCMR